MGNERLNASDGAFGKSRFLSRLVYAGPEIMLRKYAQVVTGEMHDVQVRWFESCGLGVGQNLLAENAGGDAIQ